MRLSHIRIACCCVMLIFCAILSGCASDRSTPEAIVKAYVNAVYSGDGEGALQCFNTQALNTRQNHYLAGKIENAAQQSAKLVEQRGGLSDIEIVSIQQLDGTPDKLKVTVKAIFGDESEVVSHTRVERVQDEYFITM